MAQPLLTHAFGFSSLILVGWIPGLLLDLGALGLGLNRASFNGSNQGWFQPLPPVPLDLIFSHTQLYYRMLVSQGWKGPPASSCPAAPSLDEDVEAQREAGTCPRSPSRERPKLQVSRLPELCRASGSETALQPPAPLVAVLFGKGQLSLLEPATVTLLSQGGSRQ